MDTHSDYLWVAYMWNTLHFSLDKHFNIIVGSWFINSSHILPLDEECDEEWCRPPSCQNVQTFFKSLPRRGSFQVTSLSIFWSFLIWHWDRDAGAGSDQFNALSEFSRGQKQHTLATVSTLMKTLFKITYIKWMIEMTPPDPKTQHSPSLGKGWASLSGLRWKKKPYEELPNPSCPFSLLRSPLCFSIGPFIGAFVRSRLH